MVNLPERAVEFEQALLSLDRIKARNLLLEDSDSTLVVQRVEQIVVPTLEYIGQAWAAGQIALSQVYMSGRICEELVDELLPPANTERMAQPKMAIAVLEDYHPLGKRIVYSVLRASGYELMDYGRMESDELVDKVIADKTQVLLISTLMLPSALHVADVRTKLKDLAPDVKIIVGGAPFRFDDELWQHVGADAMGRSAAEAIQAVSEVIGEFS